MDENYESEELSLEELDQKIDASGEAIRRQVEPLVGDSRVKFIKDKMEVQIDSWNELNKRLVRFSKDPTKRMMVKQINILLMSLVECSADIIGLYTELADIYLQKIQEDRRRYTKKVKSLSDRASKVAMGRTMRQKVKMGVGTGEYTPSEVSTEWRNKIEDDIRKGYHANFTSFKDFCDKAYLKYGMRLRSNTWVKYLRGKGISTSTETVPSVPKVSEVDEI